MPRTRTLKKNAHETASAETYLDPELVENLQDRLERFQPKYESAAGSPLLADPGTSSLSLARLDYWRRL